MKNSIKCKSCIAENPPYEYICKNCGSYIRERVYNIDLWKMMGGLIYNPTNTFRKIVYAEHKNFIIFIVFILAAKLLVDTRFISVISVGEFDSSSKIIISYILTLTSTFIYLTIYSFLLKFVLIVFDIETRFRDNLAVIIYALLPNIFAMVILFPLEMEVFGEYLFSSNPSPFIIKTTIAYTFLAVELLVKLWSIILIYKAFKTQTEDTTLSLANTVIFVSLFGLILYYLSLIIFTL